jgi:transcriptional adapter 3
MSVVTPIIDESVKKTIIPNRNNLKRSNQEALISGPLTQRLISALIEQNLMTSFDNGLADYLDKIGPTPASMYMSPKTMALNMFSYNSSNSSLEKKLKKTLIEQKILDSDDASSENETKPNIQNDLETDAPTDEIAEEIKNLHNELKIVSSQCKQTLNDLLSESKKSLVKQELKAKISRLDDEASLLSFSLKKTLTN